MKKILLSFTFSLSAIFSFAQFPNNSTTGNASTLYHDRGGRTADGGFVNTYFADTATANTYPIAGQRGGQIIVNDIVYVRDSTVTKWLTMGGGSGSLIAGGPITSIPILGDNPGTNISSADFIINSFYKSQAPTASLTGGVNLEFRSAQTMSYTLNWSAGRQSATEPLQSVIVASVAQTFSQPAAGSSVSGTQSVSFPANTTITYSNVVTTTDGKSTTATTTFPAGANRYFGWITDTTGIGTFGFDDSKITALGNEFSMSKVKSWNTGNPSGIQFYVYAYYYTAGYLTNFQFNNFQTLAAMNVVQRQFINALGFTGQWIIYWNKNGQILPSDLIAN